MAFLFINPVWDDIRLFVIEKSEIQEECIIKRGDDFSQFPEMIVEVVDRHSIKEIWCVCGPWAFTWVRIVTLTLNTLALSKHIQLKGCHFFELIKNHIPALRANEREYIIAIDGLNQLKEKNLIEEGSYMGYGEKNDFTNKGDFIEYREDIREIVTLFAEKPCTDNLSPIYLKDPHITWSKKSI